VRKYKGPAIGGFILLGQHPIPVTSVDVVLIGLIVPTASAVLTYSVVAFAHHARHTGPVSDLFPHV